MDNQRLFLYAALVMMGMLLWQQWQIDYAPRPQPTEVVGGTNNPQSKPVDPNDVPESAVGEVSDDSVAVSSEEPDEAEAQTAAQLVKVITDRLEVLIDLKGGTIAQVDLLTYPVSLKQKDTPFRLMSSARSQYLVAQSGLDSKDQPAPNHKSLFSATQTTYELGGAESLRVPLSWQQDGVEVSKVFEFRRDSYLINLEQQIKNNGSEIWKGRQYRRLQRKGITDNETSNLIYTFIGGVILDEENKYEKIDFDDFKEMPDRQIKDSWAAIIQHYFLTAWVPEKGETNNIYTSVIGDTEPKRYVLGLMSPYYTVPVGETKTLTSRFYVGPKEQDRLKEVADKLHLTVDYGALTIIAEPLFWLLSKIHDYVGNWGWAIILVTLTIKLVFYKLSEAAYKSMARMRKLQPKLLALKERYGDDRTKIGQATMELYKKEKVNPLGGCLPMLVQIPVFIALYWTLLESVELRQAPFMFWLHDLSVKDPYFVLPLVMGFTMWFQQRLNPAPIDPIQAKMFQIMPFAFTIFFAFFPAGLVLYWVMNNTLSIAQQWYITKHVIGEAKPINKDKKASTKKHKESEE